MQLWARSRERESHEIFDLRSRPAAYEIMDFLNRFSNLVGMQVPVIGNQLSES